MCQSFANIRELDEDQQKISHLMLNSKISKSQAGCVFCCMCDLNTIIDVVTVSTDEVHSHWPPYFSLKIN